MMRRTYYLANGFKEDCSSLLLSYDQTNSIRFKPFCDLWKEMKFALIFAGRQTYSELLEYCEEVLHIAKQFLFPPRNFKERIGGLYLIYGLYYKMPIKDTLKIRLTDIQWTNLMDLHEQLKEGEHLDANFILCTLIHDEAFAHTIYDHEWGLEKYYRVKQIPSTSYTVIPSLLDLTKEGHALSEISNLAKKYRQATSSMKDSKSGSDLKFFNENFVQEILNDVRRLESKKNAQMSDEVIEDEEPKSGVKRTPGRKDNNRIRQRIGDGFDMDTSEEDEDDFELLENYDPNLAETFNEEMETECEIEGEAEVNPTNPKVTEVLLPSNVKIKEDVDSSD